MGGRRIPFHSNEKRNFPTDGPPVATNLSGSDGNGRATGAHTPGGDSGAGGGPVRRRWKCPPGSAACLIGPGATPPASKWPKRNPSVTDRTFLSVFLSPSSPSSPQAIHLGAHMRVRFLPTPACVPEPGFPGLRLGAPEHS